MFSLVKVLGIQALLKREFAPFLVAFAIAEFAYKFKSFTFECVAFLVTWYALSYVQALIIRTRRY